MSIPGSESNLPRYDCVSDSPYTEIIYDDFEGDTTVRPIPPERMAQAVAERDKINKGLAMRKQRDEAESRSKPASPEGNGDKGNGGRRPESHQE
jgi:hypothetical protein